jgi:hypothetical protein
MLQWEDAHGSIDGMRDRLALLQGDIESLTGRANELRTGGAGSDVLGPIQQQIAAMEAQAAAVRNAAQNSPVDKMQKQLEDLQRQGQILQLQYDVKFDPLTQQIANLANTTKELSFEDIVDGMNREQAAIDRLQPKVDQATRVHDRLQNSYDRSNDKLTSLRDAYDRTSGTVNSLEEALRSMGTTAQDALSKTGKGADAALKKASASTKAGPKISDEIAAFRGAQGGNWADPGKDFAIGRESRTDESQQILDFAEQQRKKMADLYSTHGVFDPLKDAWNRTWGWVKEHVGPVVDAVGGAIRDGFSAIQIGGGGSSFTKSASNVVDKVVSIFQKGVEIAVNAWKLFGPDIKRIFKALVDFFVRIWNDLGPEFLKLLKALWPIAKFLGGVLLAAVKILASVFSRILGPALDFVIDILIGLMRIIRGVAEVIVAVFSGDLLGIIKGFWNIFAGVFLTAWAIIKGVVRVIWNVVEGLVMGIVDFWNWCRDVLVGHSIIPDMINEIINVFTWLRPIAKWVWNHVLKPIVSAAIKASKWVIGVFKKWWPWVTGAFKILWTLGKWYWNHILEPVFTRVVGLWNKYVSPELKKWWGRIKNVWSVIKALGRWVWDNLLEPVWNKIKGLWDNHVKGELGKWWSRITNVWSTLKRLGGWIKDNVMDPIFDRIKSGWERIRDWLSGAKDMLSRPAAGIVNAVISGVNKLIGGLNKISDILPGIDFSIGLIPKLAAGGPIPERRVGNGFVTRGARAIVGEGKANWPEFVIPTDPTHRNRARALLGMAQQKLGVPGGETTGDQRKILRKANGTWGGVPLFAIGGLIGNLAKGAWNRLKDLPKNAAGAIWRPLAGIAKDQIRGVGWVVPRSLAMYGVDKMGSWVTQADDALQASMSAADKKYGGMGGKGHEAALRFAKSQVGKPYQWGGVGPSGYDCSGFMSALTNIIRGKPPHSRVGATSTFPWSGFKPGYGGGFTIGSTRSYAGGVGHMAGTLNGVNVESSGGIGVHIGAGARGWNDPGFTTAAHLARGAIIRSTANGTLARIGEGRNDEAVMPLPRDWRSNAFGGRNGGGDTVVNINGNLEFPNITDGDDAMTFIENIKILARD